MSWVQGLWANTQRWEWSLVDADHQKNGHGTLFHFDKGFKSRLPITRLDIITIWIYYYLIKKYNEIFLEGGTFYSQTIIYKMISPMNSIFMPQIIIKWLWLDPGNWWNHQHRESGEVNKCRWRSLRKYRFRISVDRVGTTLRLAWRCKIKNRTQALARISEQQLIFTASAGLRFFSTKSFASL